MNFLHMSGYQEKKLQGISKGKRTQFEEIGQASRSYIVGMLEFSDQESKTTMITLIILRI